MLTQRLRVRLCGPTQEAGVQRVLIVDWDIHHGNGTQAMFYGDASVLYISIHRWDNGLFFPGTGAAAEVGHGGACGYTVNIPWNGPGAQDGDYLAAFRHVLLPIAQDFAPGLVLVSAGFDAAEGDPLGECHVSPALYAHMTQMLLGIGPLVLLLEGGYNLAATAECTAACIRVQLGEQPPDLPPGPQQQMSSQAKQALVATLQAHAPYWQPAVDELTKVAERQGLSHGGGAARVMQGPPQHQGLCCGGWSHRGGQQPVMAAADDAAALSLSNMPLRSATCAAAWVQRSGFRLEHCARCGTPLRVVARCGMRSHALHYAHVGDMQPWLQGSIRVK
ncbi:hypothetical protein V8C86DRAFT_1034492 [Haematococcus lacustris]